jgi:hypothetical protein
LYGRSLKITEFPGPHINLLKLYVFFANLLFDAVRDFKDIQYLLTGSSEQQRVYELLTEHCIMQTLSRFDPVLVGTFPLDIQVLTSDIDVICYANDLVGFSQYILESFGEHQNFKLNYLPHFDPPAIVANFTIRGQEIEIFGQNKPSDKQMGYLHLAVEDLILMKFGETFKENIIQLKTYGMKTEPAFCQLLGLSGNPYIELIKYGFLIHK